MHAVSDAVTSRSVAEILDQYARVSLPLLSRRTQGDYRRHVALLRQRFGDKLAEDLRPSDFTQFMNVARGRIQRNRQIAVLSSAFSEAIRWRWIDTNVCKHIRRNESKRRERVVTDKEFQDARQMASQRVRRVMDLALHTGQLQGQIITLLWDQVDKTEIRFRDTRTGKKIVVPITPEIANDLNACGWQSRDHGEYVIKKRDGQPYTSEGFRSCWQKVMKKWKRAGNDVFTFHDIRAKWARDLPKSPEGRDIRLLTSQVPGSIAVRPRVFEVPTAPTAKNAVAVMMPFKPLPKFDRVYATIRNACTDAGFHCQRASDIWEASTIIQDIFNLIYRAHVVIVDFTDMNGNVLYETGIAHALGRHVVPLTQKIGDVPFDIKHHRVLEYSDATDVALAELRVALSKRLKYIGE